MNRTPNWTVAVAALAALCAVLLAASLPAWAQEPTPQELAADPPGRVGRISALVGAVDVSRQAGGDWERAQINEPVTGQTALWVPPGSQAEVRIGSASVRLDADTQAVFSQLDDHAIAIDVAQGTVRVRVRSLPTGDAFSIAADGVRAEAQGPGDYRVGYDPDRRAYTLRALSGGLRVVTPSNNYNLEAGQESLVEQGGQRVQLHAQGERDAFDAWAEARDRQQDALASSRYVSPETTGIEALDEHGRWDVTDEYGAVWYPRTVREGWAPYRYGHWAHVHPWGWTWVDDAPWGFAPFHYGRWAHIGSRWGWVPGPVVARPVWAPALVGYVGGYSSGLSLSIGIGGGAPVGWFPLGPYEVYHPPYRYSQRHWDHVNWHRRHHDRDDWRHRKGRDHDRDDDRRMTHSPAPGYRYAKRPDALTVVNAEAFRASRAVGSERMRLDAGQIAQLAPVAPGLKLATVTPNLANSVASGGGSPVLTLPAAPDRRERAGSPRLDNGVLVRERDRDQQRGNDDARERRGPRERGDDGDRRLVVRPPATQDDARFDRGERGEGERATERAGTDDRNDRDRRPSQPATSPVTPLPRSAVIAPTPRPGLPGTNVIQAPAPGIAGRAAQGAPGTGSVQQPAAPIQRTPLPTVQPRDDGAQQPRAAMPVPERRMQAPNSPPPRALPPSRVIAPPPAPALPMRSQIVQPPAAAGPTRSQIAPAPAGPPRSQIAQPPAPSGPMRSQIAQPPEQAGPSRSQAAPQVRAPAERMGDSRGRGDNGNGQRDGRAMR